MALVFWYDIPQRHILSIHNYNIDNQSGLPFGLLRSWKKIIYKGLFWQNLSKTLGVFSLKIFFLEIIGFLKLLKKKFGLFFIFEHLATLQTIVDKFVFKGLLILFVWILMKFF